MFNLMFPKAMPIFFPQMQGLAYFFLRSFTGKSLGIPDSLIEQLPPHDVYEVAKQAWKHAQLTPSKIMRHPLLAVQRTAETIQQDLEKAGMLHVMMPKLREIDNAKDMGQRQKAIDELVDGLLAPGSSLHCNPLASGLRNYLYVLNKHYENGRISKNNFRDILKTLLQHSAITKLDKSARVFLYGNYDQLLRELMIGP